MIKIRWKSARRKIIPMVLGTVILLSLCIQIFDPINSYKTSLDSTNTQSIPQPSLKDFENPIIGIGNNRSVFLYMQNYSTTSGVNNFNISSEDDTHYLNDGIFNITMEPNFNTTFTIEDDNSLEYERELVTIPLSKDNFSIITGTDLLYGFVVVDSANVSNVGMVETNISIDANAYTLGLSTILGFKIEFDITCYAGLLMNSSLYNYETSQFDILNHSFYIPESGVPQTISYYIRNENLNYVDLNKNLTLNLVLANDSVTDFTIDWDSFSVDVIRGHEVSIVDDNPVALEFALLGDATVYGFQTWIRALNLTDAVTSNLTVQLYEFNQTEVLVPRSELMDITATEDDTPLVTPSSDDILHSENSYLNFSVDGPFWFNFLANKSGVDLELGNYYIKILANTTGTVGEKRFTLVTIPWDASILDPFDPDGDIDHLLLQNITVWDYVEANLKFTTNHPRVDAANFAINLTRAYLPSEIGLTIDNIPVEDTYTWDHDYYDTFEDSDPVVRDYASYWWGCGTVNLEFSEAIHLIDNKFTVPLDWDDNIYSDNITFDVDYLAQKYALQPVPSLYELVVDVEPVWNLTLEFDPEDSMFNDWNFTKFAFLVPDNWAVTDLTKEAVSVLDLTVDPIEKDGFEYIILNSSVADVNGTYNLLAESVNYMKTMTTFLSYAGNEWETNGFMQDDNVSLAVGLLTSSDLYLQSPGEVTASLFNPDGEKMLSNILLDGTIDENSTYSWFKFEHSLLFETDGASDVGEYTLIVNWTDGDQAGILQQAIYLNQYDAVIHEVNHLEDLLVNQLIGTVNAFPTDLLDYDLNIFAVEPLLESTDSFVFNESRDESIGENLYLTNIAFNETVLNAEENVLIEIDLENRHPTLDYDVTVIASIVYLDNLDWIVANTSELLTIPKYGQTDGSHNQKFVLSLTIPTVLNGGENCPIRNIPMKLHLTYKIDDVIVGEKTESQLLYYTEVNESDFEGIVLTSKTYQDQSGPSFTSNIARNFLNLPGDVTYFAQVYNGYHMCMVGERNFTTLDNKISGTFNNFRAAITPIDHLATQTITGIVMDENDVVFKETEIEFYYDNRINYTDGSIPNWTPLPSTDGLADTTTDETGAFEFEFDMSLTPYIPEVYILVKFGGNDTHMIFDSSLTVVKNQYESDIEITLDANHTLIQGDHNLVSGFISNTGNSTITNVNISLVSPYAATANILSGLDLVSIEPGEIHFFQIDFCDEDFAESSTLVNITVSMTIEETGETYSENQEFTLDTYRTNRANLTTTALLVLFGVGAVGLWVFGGKYVKTKIEEINAPIVEETMSKPKKTKRRGGKYVSISDLAKKEVSKEKPGKGTSLDDLLDEE
ncbi:MAG: hypothetical protein ACTSYI_14815 [Promethearchaeota archaeon]